MFSWLDLLLVMGFAWTITGAAGLVFRKSPDTGSSLFGTLLLIIFGLTLADNFLKPGMLPGPLLRFFYIPGRNAYFLIGPALWFYTDSLLNPGRELKAVSFLHLLPFLIWSGYFFVNPQTAIPLHAGAPPLHAHPTPLMQLRDLSSISSRLVYSIFVFTALQRHRRETRQFYSSIGFRITISWLTALVAVYAAIYITDGLLFFIPRPAGQLKEASAMLTRIVPSLLFIFLFSLLARDQGVPEDRRTAGKYRTSSLSDTEAQKIFERLNRYLETDKAYMDPELTLDTLASELGETRHRLSETINKVSGESFYNLVNNYRLREFITCFSENRYPEYTILAVAFECGFKSASAFYTVFRKATGITPREYLRENRG